MKAILALWMVSLAPQRLTLEQWKLPLQPF
jgi:hypothetical protein